MNSRSLFIFTILGLLLVSSLDAAKAAKGKKGNASEYTAAQKPKDVKTKSEEPAEDTANPSLANSAGMQVLASEVPAPKIMRPKILKVITAYDKCKLECQKIRDKEDLHSYATQLREELATAEAALGEATLIENVEQVVVA